MTDTRLIEQSMDQDRFMDVDVEEMPSENKKASRCIHCRRRRSWLTFF